MVLLTTYRAQVNLGRTNIGIWEGFNEFMVLSMMSRNNLIQKDIEKTWVAKDYPSRGVPRDKRNVQDTHNKVVLRTQGEILPEDLLVGQVTYHKF